MTGAYPQTPRNSVNRLRNRAAYDFATVHSLMNEAVVLHVSFVPDPSDPFPIVLPMIGKMGCFTDPTSTDLDQPLDLYLHGSIASRIMKLSQKAIDEGEPGFAVCVSATRVDGYVMALTPFHHSYNFRSATVHGYGAVVEDAAEKMYGLQLITNKIVPERWQNTRTPPNKVEMQSTHILRVKVSSASAKLRWGVPNGDRADLKNPEILKSCWAGVIPMWEEYGEPIPGPHNQAAIPAHIAKFVRDTNANNRKTALQASDEQVNE